MKKAFTSLMLFLAFLSANSQTFTLSDTSFTAGSSLCSYRIAYEFSKPLLRPESKPFLDSLSNFLKKHPSIELEVRVHSDLRTSDLSNDLTKPRAVAIINYIADSGIEAARLKATGYGKKQPLVTAEKTALMATMNEQGAAHAKNRRTEFIITAL